MNDRLALPVKFSPGTTTRIQAVVPPRLLRMRFMARLLDTIIVLPGGFRIGIDPIIGLIPGFGDVISTALSLYLVYQAARLGIPVRVLLVMIFNVAIESLVGLIPFLGDIFDAIYKANMRNLVLTEKHFSPALKPRSGGKILGFLAFFSVVSVLLLFWAAWVIVQKLWLFITQFT